MSVLVEEEAGERRKGGAGSQVRREETYREEHDRCPEKESEFPPRHLPRGEPGVRRPPMESLAFEDRPTTPFSLRELQGGFGDRYISDRRFDEVVLAFLRREGNDG